MYHIYISLGSWPAVDPLAEVVMDPGVVWWSGLNSSAPGRQTAAAEEGETSLVCLPLRSDVTRCSWCLEVQQTDFDHFHVTATD